jgi:methionyl-tRNA formyltransferase
MLQLLLTYLPSLEQGTAVYSPQPPGQKSYYPKRTPDDGGIDWNETSGQIHRLVRAVAPPYPGAFAFVNGTRIIVRRAQPFDAALFHSSVEPGVIVDVSLATSSLVVKTVDGSILISDFSGIRIEDLRVGMRLTGVDRARQYADLPARYGEDIGPEAWEINPARSRA